MSSYNDFLRAKVRLAEPKGFEVDPSTFNPLLKPHQRAIATWLVPVQACSDEELEGYASIHPEAAQELARRIVAGQHSRDAEVEELQSQLFDSPQYADDFIHLARRTLKCRDMHIKARVTLTDEKGNPLIDKKTRHRRSAGNPTERSRAGAQHDRRHQA